MPTLREPGSLPVQIELEVHTDPHRSISLAGARGLRGAKGRLLTATAMNAHNTFEHPDAVAPTAIEDFSFGQGDAGWLLPPKSLAVLEVR